MAGDRHPRPGEQVTGLPLGIEDDFLSVSIDGAHYAAGDVVPMISTSYGTRPSGLLVPSKYTRVPAPLDSVATYVTSAEIFGVTIPAVLVVEHLQRLPLLDVMGFCAKTLGRIDRPGYTQAQVDGLVLDMFVPDVRRRLAALLADGERVLVAPHVLLTLLKHAARFSPDSLPTGVEPGQVLTALFGTGDDLQRLAEPEGTAGNDDYEDDHDLVIGTGMPGRLEREIVAIHHFHRQTEPRHVLARFIRLWTQLPNELADDPDVLDLPAEFRDAVGVSLEEFIAAGVMLHSVAISDGGPRFARDGLTQLGLDATTAERIVGMVACTPAELRTWARSPESLSPWEFTHLERFPIIDCGDHLLIIRPDLVLRRFFGWLPLFDIEAGLDAGKDGRKKLSRIQGCVQHLSEIYARETLHAQAHRHGLRLFAEAELRAALSPGQGRKTSDVTVDDGRRWAVFEMTTSRLTRASVSSTSAEGLEKDFDKLLQKIRQLDATITSLRVREATLTGDPVPSGPRRYFPVLVLTEGFPVNPITLTMLRQRADEAGLLHGDDVNELEVVDAIELEILEGATFGEITVLDALEAKGTAALRRANMRDFLLREQQLRTTTPDRIAQLARASYAITENVMGHPTIIGST